MNGTLIVFARRPERGQVKTRIGRVLGDDAALDLHQAFLADTLHFARSTGHRVVLARTPGPHCPEDDRADEVIEQRGDGFGTRFDDAIGQVADRHDGALVLIGSDTPHLGQDAVEAAFSALQTASTVVGPAPRGGFHLIGFRERPVPVQAVFAETDEVAALTALVGRQALHLLPACRDLDEVEDLHALLEDTDPGRLPEKTREALARWLPEAARRPPRSEARQWTGKRTGN